MYFFLEIFIQCLFDRIDQINKYETQYSLVSTRKTLISLRPQSTLARMFAVSLSLYLFCLLRNRESAACVRSPEIISGTGEEKTTVVLEPYG